MIQTVGIAESVDLGNFDREETAVVLLDPIVPNFGFIPRSGTAANIDLLAEAIGAVASHEAGHFFGAAHTDPRNSTLSIMDTGACPRRTRFRLGVGPDGIFGTTDDRTSLFAVDDYDPTSSPYIGGRQDTAAIVATGLSTGMQGAYINGVLYLDANLNRTRDAGEAGLAGWRVFADINNDGVFQSGEPQGISRAMVRTLCLCVRVPTQFGRKLHLATN